MKRFIGLGCLASLLLSACGPAQTATCAKYVDCTNSVAPSNSASVDSIYGVSGTCWHDQTTASACDITCTSGLNALRNQNPNVAACQ